MHDSSHLLAFTCLPVPVSPCTQAPISLNCCFCLHQARAAAVSLKLVLHFRPCCSPDCVTPAGSSASISSWWSWMCPYLLHSLATRTPPHSCASSRRCCSRTCAQTARHQLCKRGCAWVPISRPPPLRSTLHPAAQAVAGLVVGGPSAGCKSSRPSSIPPPLHHKSEPQSHAPHRPVVPVASLHCSSGTAPGDA